MTQEIQASKTDRELLDRLLLELQRRRIDLIGQIMALQTESPTRWPRTVTRILVALLQLQQTNRRAMASLGLPRS